MKAAYIRVPFAVDLRDIPIPQLAGDEVLVRVSARAENSKAQAIKVVATI